MQGDRVTARVVVACFFVTVLDGFDIQALGVAAYPNRFDWRDTITALVEPQPGCSLDEAALIAHVKEHLAHYKAPKRVFEIPTVGRAANGKLDYKRLKAEAIERLSNA